MRLMSLDVQHIMLARAMTFFPSSVEDIVQSIGCLAISSLRSMQINSCRDIGVAVSEPFRDRRDVGAVLERNTCHRVT